MEHEELSIDIFYDDAHNPIAPEAEASVLMAIHFGVLGEDKDKDGQLDNEPKARSTILQPYQEDLASFEAKRAVSLEWLNLSSSLRLDASSPPAQAQTIKQKVSIVAPASVTTTTKGAHPTEAKADALEYEEEEEEEEEGMGERGFTREATSDDEPWILESIIKRRVNKSHPQREHQYLCKWKYYIEPTWEGRELLEDEGFLAHMNEFDGIKALLTLGGTQRTKGGKDICLSREPRIHPHSLPVVDRSDIENVFGYDLNLEVVRQLAECDLAALYYMSVAIPARVAAFVTKWRSLSKTHRPVILFHGTRSWNILPIVENSLVVPSQSTTSGGVKVTNGSLYGVGIYTADVPITSTWYCNNRSEDTDSFEHKCGEMFVCLGLVSNDDTENICIVPGFCTVFFDAALVMPLWVVGYRMSAPLAKSNLNRQMPRKNFNSHFNAHAPILAGSSTNPHNKWDELSQAKASVAGFAVPVGFRGKPMTKRTIKEAPRMIKDLYKAGALIPRRSDGQK